MEMFDVEGGVCKMVAAMENEVNVVCMRGGCCIEVDSRSKEGDKKKLKRAVFKNRSGIVIDTIGKKIKSSTYCSVCWAY